MTNLDARIFGATTTASEVIHDVDLHGRCAIVTGASSGIGTETARALASAGAQVTLAVRDAPAGQRIADRVGAGLGADAGSLRVAALDLLDPASITAFVSAWQGPLHMLVNNAGVMAFPTLSRSADGQEAQFATNHLGHYALAVGLRRALASANGARVVSVSSIGHMFSPVVFDDLAYRFRPYDPWTSYGQSKTANALFAVGAATRWAEDGVVANAVMPGNVGDTSLARHLSPEVLASFSDIEGLALPPGKTVEQGAATSVLVAASPLIDGITGRYFEDCAEAGLVSERGGATHGVAAYALDFDNAERLWTVSADLIG